MGFFGLSLSLSISMLFFLETNIISMENPEEITINYYYYYCLRIKRSLTLTLLMWTKWRAPTNASKWRMGFSSAFKGLIITLNFNLQHKVDTAVRSAGEDFQNILSSGSDV